MMVLRYWFVILLACGVVGDPCLEENTDVFNHHSELSSVLKKSSLVARVFVENILIEETKDLEQLPLYAQFETEVYVSGTENHNNNSRCFKRSDEKTGKHLNLGLEDLQFLFQKWLMQHSISSDRFEVFRHNLFEIVSHNMNKSASYLKGMNQFGHLTEEEFGAQFFGFDREFETNLELESTHRRILEESVASSIDWVDKGAVTPVKNQGQCGSCWAFSAVGALEGAYFLKTGTLVSFSEQELVDCDWWMAGCSGGRMGQAQKYVKTLGGLCTEHDYPYKAKKQTCQKSKCSKKEDLLVKKVHNVARDSGSLKVAVSKMPVSIGIEADQKSFQFYKSGVLTDDCGARVDHGVLAVGYGTLKGVDYWKVKNSWGTTYGRKYLVVIRVFFNKYYY